MEVLKNNKDIIFSMAENRCSAGKIADYLSTIGVITTETEINKFLREQGFVRPNKSIKSRSTKNSKLDSKP